MLSKLKKPLKSRLKRFFPFVRWAKKYSKLDLVYDVIAGLTVGMTVIPQSLAYATIAGLPIQYGLYSSFMGLFMYSIFGTSKDVTYGPTAVMSLLVYQYTHLTRYDKIDNISQITSINSTTNISVTDFKEMRNMLHMHYAIILTFVSGIMQAVMGFVHLGFLISFISHPVLNGFTNAAAIIIAIGQIKNILGIKVAKSHFLLETIHTFRDIGKTNPWDCALGICSLILLLIMKKLNRSQWLERKLFSANGNNSSNDSNRYANKLWQILKILIHKSVWLLLTGRNAAVIALSAIVAYWLNQTDRKVNLTPSVQGGLPPWTFPPRFNFRYDGTSLNASSNNISSNTIFVSAKEVFQDISFGFLTISLIGILESLAIAKSFARKHKYTIDPTQEFVALGISNVMSSFVSSYPITASFSRLNYARIVFTNRVSTLFECKTVWPSITAINSQTGVRTQAGGIFTGLLVLLALRYLTSYFRFIPKASLAAMIISAVLNLIEYKIFVKIWKVKKMDFVVAITTLIACFFVGVEFGIILGIVLAMAFLVYPISKPHLYIELDENDANGLKYYIIKPNQSLFYPSGEYFTETLISECLLEPLLEQEEDEPSETNGEIKANGTIGSSIPTKNKKLSKILADVIIDCSHIQDFDFTIIQELKELNKEFKAMNKQLVLCNINEILGANIMDNLKDIKTFKSLNDAKLYFSEIIAPSSMPLLVVRKECDNANLC
ncbi:sodium-independent sulfate anion transporter-like isoform X2 [Gordionus sp. m RMFG-2023]|uniref:sodium-independent sulfate anion transporter-like isoform X2 n=1 Tax=Gordionus sp. m RMFG-2023 TaxID=3053472 RepID=UPI0031FCFFBB